MAEEVPHRAADVRRLERALKAGLAGEVRFDAGSLAAYATDASNYRQVPIGVVVPKSKRDVIEAGRICREHGAPLLLRGGGTSLAGQCCNVAVVLDTSKYYRKIRWLDPAKRQVRVEPGVVLDRVREAARVHGLTVGPDPATHDHCTIGGMLGNNSCGMHAQMAGRMSDNVESLEVLTADGLVLEVGATNEDEYRRIVSEGGRRAELYRGCRALAEKYGPLIRERYPRIPRRISGYNLDDLLPENGFHLARALVGSEGTLVTILEATVRLVDDPRARSLLVLGYPTVYEAADHVGDVVASGPIALEGLDDVLINGMRKKRLDLQDLTLLPEGRGWLMCEFGGDTKQEADQKARALMQTLSRSGRPPTMSLFDDPAQEALLWEVREAGLGATARVPGEPDTWEGWEDAAVPPERLGEYLRSFRALLDRYRYHAALYGHFGQGCVHTRISFDLVSGGGIARFRQFVDEAADLVVRCGGSLSGEHGDGQSRAELLPKMFGPELVRAFEEFKALWDPENRLNPHKIVHPYRITENLRLGEHYRPHEPKTHFGFPEEDGKFSRATTRCVGVGTCRRERGGTMCPSYQVTREELHSTRGRSRLLFEMLEGDPVKHGWRSREVKDALDLCLSCKGCKGDCPVNVDMATYKAEFLSHHYQGRLRPRAAYAFGLVMFHLAAFGRFPKLVNALTQGSLSGRLLKRLAGVAPERTIPKLAPMSFQFQAQFHRTLNPLGPEVILFPDTFTNYFHPEVGDSALEVLETAGFRVTVPQAKVCCGRPLYDYGMLDTAKALLERTLRQFRDELRRGVPFVVSEPSCAAVFRDELCNLLPDDEDAKRLRDQTFVLSEFLEKHAPEFELPKLHRKALVQRHCHHGAVLDFKAEEKFLKRLGVAAEIPASGCCGMAGAFGYEKSHYGVSVACAERVILPRTRAVSDDTVIVADGFSCRSQLAQLGPREPMHIAQLARLALRPDGSRSALEIHASRYKRSMAGTYAFAAFTTGVALWLAWRGTRKQTRAERWHALLESGARQWHKDVRATRKYLRRRTPLGRG